MKLESDLIEEILIWCENNLPTKDNTIFEADEIHLEGYNQNQIAYHIEMLADAGYIKMYDSGRLYLNALNIKGHLLLDTMRNDTVGNKIKNYLEKNGLKTFLVLLPQIIEYLKPYLK